MPWVITPLTTPWVMEQKSPIEWPTGLATSAERPIAPKVSKLISSVKFRVLGPPTTLRDDTGAPFCSNLALVRQLVANAGVKQHNPIPKMKILIRCLNMVNIQVGYNRDFLDG